eukprot:scaffold37_cov172-Ochromonas_danica.AAC.16
MGAVPTVWEMVYVLPIIYSRLATVLSWLFSYLSYGMGIVLRTLYEWINYFFRGCYNNTAGYFNANT